MAVPKEEDWEEGWEGMVDLEAMATVVVTEEETAKEEDLATEVDAWAEEDIWEEEDLAKEKKATAVVVGELVGMTEAGVQEEEDRERAVLVAEGAAVAAKGGVEADSESSERRPHSTSFVPRRRCSFEHTQ